MGENAGSRYSVPPFIRACRNSEVLFSVAIGVSGYPSAHLPIIALRAVWGALSSRSDATVVQRKLLDSHFEKYPTYY